MIKWIKRVFTHTEVSRKGAGRKLTEVEVPPSTRLLYSVYMSIVMLASLIVLQIVHLIVLREWNASIWAGITGLIGTLSGIFLGAKA